MAPTPRFPPLDGSIPVLPGFVDFHAEHNPNLPWVAFPSKDDPTKVSTISFAQLAGATHRVAHALRPHRSEGRDGDVVGVVIHCDSVLYLAVLVGLVRAGFVPFPMSPRNSAEAICSMLEKTNSHRVVSQSSLAPLISKVREELDSKQYPVQVDELPSLHSVFPFLAENGTDEEVVPYPSSGRPYHPDDVVTYIHSSGSTGYPKPIPQRQKQVLSWCCSAIIVKGRDRAVHWASMHLPTFHTIGYYMQLYAPLVSGYAIGAFAPQAPASPVVPNPKNVLEVARLTGCTGIPTVPAFIEAWAQSEDSVKFLASLQILAFSGGPLSEKNGNKLAAAGVKLFAVYGGTEFGAYTDVFDTDDSQGPDAQTKTSADWAWLSFCDRVKPRWVPQGDGSYELQFLTCEGHYPAIENLPDIGGYATNDLFEPHPTKQGLWKITGRKDDVLILGSGENVVPLPQEGTIASHPMVSGAVMFGRGRNEPGILIELHPEHAIDPKDESAVIHFRNLIWPVVEEANRTAPAFARIFKEMIIVADPARPFPRAAKGTWVRKQTLALYENEIEQLYNIVEDSKDTKGIAPPASWVVEDVEAWLLEHASAIRDAKINPSTDLFDQGFDSLYTTFLRNRIIGAMRTSDDPHVRKASTKVPQNFIFDHPTLRKLAAGVAGLIDPVSGPQHKDHVKDIEDTIARYSKNIPTFTEDVIAKHSTKLSTANQEIVVLLTGATGNIGSHVLASLLLEPRISRVYTLNRASANGPRDRQEAAFAARNLPVELARSPKLFPLVGDLALQNLGLESVVFNELKHIVTHVIHNAWKVDFNHALSSFESHIAAARKLIDELFTFDHRPRLLFTSSIAAVQGWDVTKGVIPEEPLSDPSLAVSNGYGASKYVTEQLLVKAAQNGLETTTLRIGQVCGSKTTGAWSPTEWVPILVKSSLALGAFPDLDGTVSWIPMDALSSTIVDVVLSTEKLPLVLNMVHPHRAAWRAVLRAVNEATAANLPFVPYKEWLARLEEVAEEENSQEHLEKIPGIKLLAFFRSLDTFGDRAKGVPEDQVEAAGLAAYSTTLLEQFSPSIRDLPHINEVYAQKWVSYWKQVGFLA